jgi:hypothetical protein
VGVFPHPAPSQKPRAAPPEARLRGKWASPGLAAALSSLACGGAGFDAEMARATAPLAPR